VLDYDWISKDDHLGVIRPMGVTELQGHLSQDIPIFKHAIYLAAGSHFEEGAGKGVVTLGFHWLDISKKTTAELGDIHNFSCRDALVTVQLRTVFLPPSMADEGIQVRMKVGDRKQATWYHTPSLTTRANAMSSVDRKVVDIVRKGGELQVHQKTLAKVTGLPQHVVRQILIDHKAQTDRLYPDVSSKMGEVTELAVEFHKYLCAPVQAQFLPDTKVVLEIVNRKREVIGTATLEIKELGLKWPPSDVPSLLVFQTGSASRIMADASLIVQGLEANQMANVGRAVAKAGG